MHSEIAPVQIALITIVDIMELAKDEALPQNLLPGVNCEVVEAKTAALTFA